MAGCGRPCRSQLCGKGESAELASASFWAAGPMAGNGAPCAAVRGRGREKRTIEPDGEAPYVSVLPGILALLLLPELLKRHRNLRKVNIIHRDLPVASDGADVIVGRFIAYEPFIFQCVQH